MVLQCKIPTCRTLGSKGFYGFPKNSLVTLNAWKDVCKMEPGYLVKPSDKICFRHFFRHELIRRGNSFVPKSMSVPKEGILTSEFPSILDEVPPAEDLPKETQSANKSISFCLQHQGSTKYFTVNEGKTVSELDSLIKNLGKCSAPFKIPTIPKGLNPTTSLATLKLPPTNFIELFCSETDCKARFSSQVTNSENSLLFQERIKLLEMQAENERLKRDLEKSRKSNNENREGKKYYKQKFIKLKEKFQKRKKSISKKEKKEIVHDALKDIFTPKQIDCFLRGASWKQGKNWQQEDFSLALTLRTLNKRTYNFLRDKKLLPMPAERTLRKYFQHFKINEGFIEPVARLLEIMVQDLSEKERVVALSFDEVHVKSDISYDSQDDRILGPHSKANTM